MYDCRLPGRHQSCCLLCCLSRWLSKHHPDPELKQFRVLQDALRHLLHKLTSVPVDPLTEVYVPTAESLPLRDFQSKPLYLWYDYFSCPQLEQSGESRSGSQLADAIDSIPAYIAECSYFLGLCPATWWCWEAAFVDSFLSLNPRQLESHMRWLTAQMTGGSWAPSAGLKEADNVPVLPSSVLTGKGLKFFRMVLVRLN